MEDGVEDEETDEDEPEEVGVSVGGVATRPLRFSSQSPFFELGRLTSTHMSADMSTETPYHPLLLLL